MPFGPKALRNTREEYVLEKIEYFKVNEYIGRSDWDRHYFNWRLFRYGCARKRLNN